MLLTFLWLLKIVRSSNRKHKKKNTEFIHKFPRELTMDPEQHIQIWHPDKESLCDSLIKKCFHYQIVKFCCHDKF